MIEKYNDLKNQYELFSSELLVEDKNYKEAYEKFQILLQKKLQFEKQLDTLAEMLKQDGVSFETYKTFEELYAEEIQRKLQEQNKQI